MDSYLLSWDELAYPQRFWFSLGVISSEPEAEHDHTIIERRYEDLRLSMRERRA